jgi:NitT/TauT family transport system substrate-binding protein
MLLEHRRQTRRAHISTISFLLGAASLSRPAAAQDLPKVRVMVLAADLFAGAYYAQDNGFFNNPRLNVEIIPTTNAGANVAAILGGAADIAISNPMTIAEAVTRSAPVTILAGAGLYSTNAATTVLCVAKTSPMRTMKDLEGKTIGVFAVKDAATAALREYLTRRNVDLSKVNFIEIPFPIMGEALAQGRIAAGMILEPVLSAALNSNARVFAKPFDAVAPEFLLTAWCATTDWIRNNPDLARRFVTDIYACGKWANTHHDETAVSLAKLAKMDVASIRATTRGIQAESLTPQLLQPLLDVAFKHDILTRPVRADELMSRAI